MLKINREELTEIQEVLETFDAIILDNVSFSPITVFDANGEKLGVIDSDQEGWYFENV